jgi:uncharacterized protein DUF6932
MSLLPEFNADGLLPACDIEMTLEELRASPLVLGFGEPRHEPNWDPAWREKLVDNLGILTRQLWEVGVTEIFADGSFVESKDHPNDIDGYFHCDFRRFVSGELERDLNLLDPHKIWTWDPRSRKPYRGYPKNQLPMWHRYRVELYPHFEDVRYKTNILDEHGNDLEFPAAFRRSRRDGKLKGIVKIVPGRVS